MSAKWVTPAWTGPGSPQGPVQLCGHAVYPTDPDRDIQCDLPAYHDGPHSAAGAS